MNGDEARSKINEGRSGKGKQVCQPRPRAMLLCKRKPHQSAAREVRIERTTPTVDPQQSGGRPCLRNLRIQVKDVLDLLAAGASREEILEDYPLLEPGDITDALHYAAWQSDHPVLRSA
jgi:uncharacterized protein (DUF433 family)